jgi:hypothetical protein
MLTHCPRCLTYKSLSAQLCRCGYDFTAESFELSSFETMRMAGVPRQFQVLSTQPELKIRYVDRIWEKIVIFLFFLPFFVLFSGHVWILLRGLYELLNLRFWQVTQIFSYDTGNLWRAPQFAFAIFLLGFASWYGLWGLLGITEIQASHDLITIRYRFLWLSRETSCSIRNI